MLRHSHHRVDGHPVFTTDAHCAVEQRPLRVHKAPSLTDRQLAGDEDDLDRQNRAPRGLRHRRRQLDQRLDARRLGHQHNHVTPRARHLSLFQHNLGAAFFLLQEPGVVVEEVHAQHDAGRTRDRASRVPLHQIQTQTERGEDRKDGGYGEGGYLERSLHLGMLVA